MQYLLGLLPFLATAAFASPIIKRADNQLIQSTLSGRCLSPPAGAAGVADGAVGIETNVVTIDCDDAAAWNISPGSGSVILSGTKYALDAGENPGSTGGLKLYTSYPGLQQQTWYLTDDNHIAITGGNQCLTETASGPNYTPCGSSAGDQEWRVYDRGSDPSPSPSPSASQSASSTASTPSPSTTAPVILLPDVDRGTQYQDPATGNGRRLHPFGRSDVCVSVQDGNAVEGAPVQLSYCFPTEDPITQFQLFDGPAVGQRGVIRLHSNPNLCLDAGNDPANGSGLKLWSCGEGWLQQSWTHHANNIYSLDNNQCLDVKMGSQAGDQTPYNSVADLQTYECDNSEKGDQFQIFFELPYPSN